MENTVSSSSSNLAFQSIAPSLIPKQISLFWCGVLEVLGGCKDLCDFHHNEDIELFSQSPNSHALPLQSRPPGAPLRW